MSSGPQIVATLLDMKLRDGCKTKHMSFLSRHTIPPYKCPHLPYEPFRNVFPSIICHTDVVVDSLRVRSPDCLFERVVIVAKDSTKKCMLQLIPNIGGKGTITHGEGLSCVVKRNRVRSHERLLLVNNDHQFTKNGDKIPGLVLDCGKCSFLVMTDRIQKTARRKDAKLDRFRHRIFLVSENDQRE